MSLSLEIWLWCSSLLDCDCVSALALSFRSLWCTAQVSPDRWSPANIHHIEWMKTFTLFCWRKHDFHTHDIVYVILHDWCNHATSCSCPEWLCKQICSIYPYAYGLYNICCTCCIEYSEYEFLWSSSCISSQETVLTSPPVKSQRLTTFTGLTRYSISVSLSLFTHTGFKRKWMMDNVNWAASVSRSWYCSHYFFICHSQLKCYTKRKTLKGVLCRKWSCNYL